MAEPALSDADVGLAAPASDADVGLAAAPKGFWESAIEAAKQVPAGFGVQQEAAAQRTTPIIPAQAPNFLGPASADELGNVGYKDKDGNFQPTDKNKHVVLTDPSDGVPKVYARTPETDEGVLASTGRMLSTMWGPGNIGFSKAIPPAIESAERIGVELPRAIATESPITRFMGQVIARAPGGGPLQEAIPKAVTQVESKVGEAANLAGGAVDKSAAGQNFSQAATAAFKQGGQIATQVEKAYNAVDNLVDANRMSPLRATAEVAQDIVTRRGGAALKGQGGAVDTVMEGITRPEGMTYKGIKDLRTNLGEMLDSGHLPEGFSERELRRIYGALSDDLRQAVINGGGARAALLYERAERLAAGVAQWRDQVRKVLGPTTRSGEGMYEAILRMASTGPSADQQTLLAARAAVPAEVWRDIASTAISQLGRNRVGVFTPAQFLSDYRNLSDVGKRALFGASGNAQVLPFLDDIAQVSDRFAQAAKLANTSGSGGHAATYAAIGAIFGGVVSAAAGGGLPALIPPVIAISSIIGNNAMARVLATPATAAAFGRWARVYQTIADRPTPAGMSTLIRASGELANNLKGQGINITPPQILRSTIQGPGSSEAGEQ